MKLMKDKKIFFPNLDGLRFIAFLMVFLWHTLKTPFEIYANKNDWINNLFYLLMNGKTGVSIFFVLSGFLITYLILAEIKLNGKLNVFKFYIRRSLRIWPLYFLLLILVFAVIPVIMNWFHLNRGQYNMRPWFYFLFIGNFDVLHIYMTNGRDLLASTITWSVAIEEQFYFIWPLLFAFIPVRFYKYIFPVLVSAAYIFRSCYAGNTAVLSFHTFSVGGDLALGGWAAYLSFFNKGFVGFFEKQSNSSRGFIYLAGIAILYFIQFAAANSLVQVYERLLQTTFFCYIILDQNFCRQNFLKFSNNRFISFWGKYTYGLYLWHPVVLLITTVLLTKVLHFSLQDASTYLIIAPVGLAVSLLVSFVSYRFFELYFLNLKKKFAYINKN